MKQAKASEADIQAVLDFFDDVEQWIEYTERPDGVSSLGELVERAWLAVGPAWRRVVFGYKLLLDNCCDPDAPTLEWRPDLKALLDQAKIDAAKTEATSPAGPMCGYPCDD